jgi:hypothetical protein
MHTLTFALATEDRGAAFERKVRATATASGSSPLQKTVREDGGVLYNFDTRDGATVQLIDDPHLLERFVHLQIPAGTDPRAILQSLGLEVRSLQELTARGLAYDPPLPEHFVPVALAANQLDHDVVELFTRGLEAADPQVRHQATVAISLAPALIFAPPLKIALAKEADSALTRMMEYTLSLCLS